MSNELSTSSVLIGAAGEHYVLAELIKRGVIAAKAPEGSPNMDIVTTDIEGNRLVALQVKTRRDKGTDKGWHMKAKHDKLFSDHMFYVFVDLGREALDTVAFYVVPSKIVAEACHLSHDAWLRRPGKNGQRHNDSEMRRFKPEYSFKDFAGMTKKDRNFLDTHKLGWLDKYKNAWDLIM